MEITSKIVQNSLKLDKKIIGTISSNAGCHFCESLGLSGDNRMRRQVICGSIAVCAQEWFFRGSSALYKREGIRKNYAASAGVRLFPTSRAKES